MTVLSPVQRKRAAWKSRVPLALLALLLLAAAGGLAGLYLYDRSRANLIAPGVTVAGVDVGGMSVDRARAKVARLILPRYRRPIEVVHGRSTFLLGAASARVSVDVAGSVATALEMSRRGSFIQRVYRELRGRRLDLSLTPAVRYDPRAVRAFVAHVERTVAFPARNARFVPSLRRPRLISSREGLAVRTRLLSGAVRTRLLDPGLARLLPLTTSSVTPKLTTRALAQRYRTFITVSRSERRLRRFERLKLVKTYVIAVGRIGLETPAGLYRIEDKQVNPAWHVPNRPWAGALAGKVIPPGPDDPLKARWLGFYDGAGIHGTDDISSLGTAASHGCIRMSIPDVVQLYRVVPLHSPLFIS